MLHKPVYLMLFILLVFSIFSFACNTVTNGMEPVPPTSVVTFPTKEQNSNPSATQDIPGGTIPDVRPTESGGSSFGTNGIPEFIPILPDAAKMMASANSIMYTTEYSKDDASEFYMTEMKKLEWIFIQAGSLNGAVANIMNFTMGSKTAIVMVGTATGKVVVQISYTE